MAKRIILILTAFIVFPIATRTAFIETELTYDCMNAKGVNAFVPYLGGEGQINLVNGNLVFSKLLPSRTGRAGFNLQLPLVYNSKIWTRTGTTQMGIAEPGSYVGLGWRIGFPYLVQGSSSYSLVLSDGSAHEIVDHGNGNWKSIDSTYIILNPANGSTPASVNMVGGTKMVFGNTVGSISYATEIRDRNGNQIFANYIAGTGMLGSINDSQGLGGMYPRLYPAMVFSYDSDGFLTHMNTSIRGYTWVGISFTYSTASLSPSFPSPYTAQLPASSEKLLTEVSVDGRLTHFAQAFSYNQFGELSSVTDKVYEYEYDVVPILVNTTSQARASYTYTTNSIYDGGASPSWRPQRMLSQKTEYVKNTGSTTNTTYSISYSVDSTKSNPSSVQVSSPLNGQTIYDLSYTSAGSNWSDGLVQSDIRKTYDGQTTLRTLTNSWSQDDPLKTFILNPRITSQTTTLDNGLTTQVSRTYATDGTGNIKETIERGFDGSVYRKTQTSYWHETHPEYSALNLTNLVSSVSIKNASDVEVSRTETGYDEYGTYPLVSMTWQWPNHDSGFGTTYLTRGNVTSSGKRFIEQSRSIDSHVQYDVAGLVVKKIDPKGNQTTFGYCGWSSFPISSTNALNQTTLYQWVGESPASDILWSSTDVNGVQTQWGYDDLNRKMYESGPSGVKTFAYDDSEYQIMTSSDSGNAESISNPTGNNLQAIEEVPDGNSIYKQLEYDALGRTSKEYVSNRIGSVGLYTSITYDVLGRPTVKNLASGGQITYQYSGNQTIVTDPEGRRKKTLYNESGQIAKVTEEDMTGNWGPETTYSYDVLGHLIQIVQGVQTRSFAYDSLGRKISESHPESGLATYAYDDNGNMIQKTDARGLITGYSYDELNRLVLISYSDSTLWSLFTYDEDTSSLISLITNGKGRMTSAWTVNSSLQTTPESVGYSWSYDQSGRVVQQVMSMDNQTYPVTYSYKANGCGCSEKDLQNITYPDGVGIVYTRDSIGRVKRIDSSDSRTFLYNVQYDMPDGSPSSVRYKLSSFKDVYTQDTAGRTASVQMYMPGNQTTKQVEIAYTYSPANQISRVDHLRKDTNGAVLSSNWYTYTYDRLARLSSEAYQSGGGTEWSNSWSYDQYGNLTGTANSTNNRLTAFSGNYDAVGNQLLDANNGYQYSAQNLIKQVTRRSDNAVIGTYRYDPLGRRVKKRWSISESGATRTVQYSYVYGQNGEILMEYKTDRTPSIIYENTSSRNVYWGTKLVSIWNVGTLNDGSTQINKTVWLRRNHRNEVIYTNTKDNNDPMATYVLSDYLYSKAYGSAGSDQFAGQKDDTETGLKDFGARYYNPLSMRWNSADPVTAHIYDPQSLNKYAYVRNDPVNKFDPNGGFWNPFSWLGSDDYNPPVDFTDFYARASLYWYAYAYGFTLPEPEVIPIPIPTVASARPKVTHTGSITSDFRNKLSSAISNMSSDCKNFFSSLGGGLDALTSSVSELQFFDAHSSRANDSFLIASDILQGAANKSLRVLARGLGAFVLQNTDGISNGIVIGSLFYGLDSAGQDMAIVHEGAHYAYQLKDDQMWAVINAYNPSFDPNIMYPNAKDPALYFNAFLLSGCPSGKK